MYKDFFLYQMIIYITVAKQIISKKFEANMIANFLTTQSQ